jgi:hypothetical protein
MLAFGQAQLPMESKLDARHKVVWTSDNFASTRARKHDEPYVTTYLSGDASGLLQVRCVYTRGFGRQMARPPYGIARSAYLKFLGTRVSWGVHMWKAP